MKERIKRFIKKNEDTIIPIALGFGSFAATLVVITKIAQGNRIENCHKREFENGATEVFVSLKNGAVQTFHWDAPTA